MSTRLKILAAGVPLLALALTARQPIVRGQALGVNRVTAVTAAELRTWDSLVDRMIREGSLELRLDREDTLIAGRRHRRFAQMVDGVPVYGGDVVRQSDEHGVTVSVFGTVYAGIGISTRARLDADEARAALIRHTGAELGPDRLPKLVIMPRAAGEYTLVYMARVATPGDITLYFLDANSGEIVAQRSDVHSQTPAIGIGHGVLGDRKKVAASSQAGTFVQSDRHRPPVIETFD